MSDIRDTPFNIPLYPINRFFNMGSRNTALSNAITAYIRKTVKPPDEPDICDLSNAELMKRYCQGLLERTRGNQVEAARHSRVLF